MNSTNLQTIFSDAEKIVKDLPDILKPVAFEMAINQLRADLIERDRLILPSPENTEEPNKDFFEVMQMETSVDKEKIKAVYRFNKDSILRVITTIDDRSRPERQIAIAYLYLMGNRIGLKKDWLGALELAQQLSELGLNDGNVSRNLKREKLNILQSGTMRAKEYSLSPRGISKAIDILRSITEIG